MDIKVLKATKQAFESTTLRFSEAMRIGTVKWNRTFELQARPSDIMKIPEPGKYHV